MILLRLRSLCIPQGGGAEDFEGGSQVFFERDKGFVKIFNRRKGEC